MGRKATTKFILQIKLIWGFYCPSRVSHITGDTTTSGMGPRSGWGVSMGVRNFDAFDHTFFLFPFTVFLSGVCITIALFDTWVTVASFHDLVLASGFACYITGSSTNGWEVLVFIGSLLLNCLAMDAFLSA